ncbi:Histone-lysine N-methyltransferase SETMAR [Eufriesea mexicana]|uniref:Histone-lysine N-methyltransferase SETMAR n=1 Tax=Eufriesea mexicana TaxID=516756 RepID=A0A310SJ95_9HYME|nr:Histone-lysine N-methyltransferase SETMAR [Eufriesea mexicana]
MEGQDAHFGHILSFYFRKGKNASQARKKLCAVYGNEAFKERQCQNWFAKFHSGDFSLKNEQQSGRPVEVDETHIKAIIDSDRHSTTREIAEKLNVTLVWKVAEGSRAWSVGKIPAMRQALSMTIFSHVGDDIREGKSGAHSYNMPHGGSGKNSNAHQNSLDDSAQSRPYFDISNSKNVTTIKGQTAYLNCRAKNWRNKTVSEQSNMIGDPSHRVVLRDLEISNLGLDKCET